MQIKIYTKLSGNFVDILNIIFNSIQNINPRLKKMKITKLIFLIFFTAIISAIAFTSCEEQTDDKDYSDIDYGGEPSPLDLRVSGDQNITARFEFIFCEYSKTEHGYDIDITLLKDKSSQKNHELLFFIHGAEHPIDTFYSENPDDGSWATAIFTYRGISETVEYASTPKKNLILKIDEFSVKEGLSGSFTLENSGALINTDGFFDDTIYISPASFTFKCSCIHNYDENASCESNPLVRP